MRKHKFICSEYLYKKMTEENPELAKHFEPSKYVETNDYVFEVEEIRPQYPGLTKEMLEEFIKSYEL